MNLIANEYNDYGFGISPSFLANLFEGFTRGFVEAIFGGKQWKSWRDRGPLAALHC